MGQAPTSHPFTLSQGGSPIEQPSAQQLLFLQCLSIPPGPRGNIPPQTQWMTCLLAGPCPRQPQKGPQLQAVRDSPLVQGTQMELLRSIQLGHQSSEGGQEGVL